MYGPTNSGNGALDYNGTFDLCGWFLNESGVTTALRFNDGGGFKSIFNIGLKK